MSRSGSRRSSEPSRRSNLRLRRSRRRQAEPARAAAASGHRWVTSRAAQTAAALGLADPLRILHRLTSTLLLSSPQAITGRSQRPRRVSTRLSGLSFRRMQATAAIQGMLIRLATASRTSSNRGLCRARRRARHHPASPCGKTIIRTSCKARRICRRRSSLKTSTVAEVADLRPSHKQRRPRPRATGCQSMAVAVTAIKLRPTAAQAACANDLTISSPSAHRPCKRASQTSPSTHRRAPNSCECSSHNSNSSNSLHNPLRSM